MKQRTNVKLLPHLAKLTECERALVILENIFASENRDSGQLMPPKHRVVQQFFQRSQQVFNIIAAQTFFLKFRPHFLDLVLEQYRVLAFIYFAAFLVRGNINGNAVARPVASQINDALLGDIIHGKWVVGTSGKINLAGSFREIHCH